MSRLENIPPDLSAVLSLLLRRGKRYSEVAGMLGIQEQAVHDRAHAALALLAPGQARGLGAAEREQLGEYLLGQQSATAASQTRDFLASSAAGRAWAQSLTSELAPLATTRPLPQIPAARETSPRTAADRAGAPAARATREPRSPREPGSPREPASTGEPAGSSPSTEAGAQPSSSRVGGAVVLGALAAIAIVVVLVIVGIGGSGSSHSGTQADAAATTPAHHTGTGASSSAGKGTSSTPATSGASTGASSTSHGKALTLSPPDPATSKAIGVAYVLTQKTQHAFYVFAKGLPALPSGAFYAVWLEGATSAADYPLGSLPAAGSSGLVEGGGPLPSSAGSYSRIIVTSETSHHPSHPGPTLLGGTFSLH